jgi:hypothetical protein
MARQLQLLEAAPDWRLDDETRAVGREGVAAARAVLAAARRAAAVDEHDGGHGKAA